jgi:hypothetical protein
MYKGFAIATVLIALVIGLFAGNLPSDSAGKISNASQEAVSNVTEQAIPAVSPKTMSQPFPTAPADPTAPLASASAPTLMLDGYTQSPHQDQTPAPITSAPAGAVEVNPIPPRDKSPPPKVRAD